MQILQEEIGSCDTVDPLAGSYYVESLTSEMEKRIVAEMERIDELGGIVKCISNGYIQNLVSRQAYKEELDIRSGQKVKVGVNKYKSEETASRDVELHEFDSGVQQEQISRLNKVKAKRDDAEINKTLDALRHNASSTDENLMPSIMDCIRAYCTVGEMSAVFLETFGEFKEPIDFDAGK
jgi:methylmalonyl-CoA mutase N-terminal domain/subunit